MPGQGVENVPNVGASLESWEVRKSHVIAEDPLAPRRLPLRRLALYRLPPRRLSPPACSPEK